MKYRNHIYTYTKPFDWITHRWSLICAEGAVEFHVQINSNKEYKNDYPPSAGLEFHSIQGKEAPDHINCPLTGGRCWHDGTSLYASETLWPIIRVMLSRGEHDSIFSVLEQEASNYFEKVLED